MLKRVKYDMPYKYIGKEVMVSETSSQMHVFYNHEKIACHLKGKCGEHVRKPVYAPPHELAVLTCTKETLQDQAKKIGPYTLMFITELLSHKSCDKLRAGRYTLALKDQFSPERLEQACQRGLYYKAISYASLKKMLNEGLDQQTNYHSQDMAPTTNFRFNRDSSIYKSIPSIQTPKEENGCSAAHRELASSSAQNSACASPPFQPSSADFSAPNQGFTPAEFAQCFATCDMEEERRKEKLDMMNDAIRHPKFSEEELKAVEEYKKTYREKVKIWEVQQQKK